MGTVFMVNVANMKFCVCVFKFDIHNNLTLYRGCPLMNCEGIIHILVSKKYFFRCGIHPG